MKGLWCILDKKLLVFREVHYDYSSLRRESHLQITKLQKLKVTDKMITFHIICYLKNQVHEVVSGEKHCL